MERPRSFIFHGAIGGIIAGAVVAAWLFVLDLIAGEPFYTAGRLSAVVLRQEFTGPWPGYILLFTELHFGIFIVLGLATAWFMKTIDLAPGLITGGIFGVGVLNTVHYTGLLVTGTDLLTVVPWVHVAAANLVGGLLMMAYLRRAWRAEPSAPETKMLAWSPTVSEGVLAGICGACVVAFWFFFLDLARGFPFATPASLGSALLLGAGNAGEVQLNIGLIVAYSFLHVTVFLAVGISLAWLANRLEATTRFWLPAAAVLLLLEGLFAGTILIRSSWLFESVSWWVILIGNVLAAITMGLFVWLRHPKLRRPEAA